MRRNCIVCDTATLVTREVDNHILVVDAEPTGAEDAVVLRGDLEDEPAAFWNVPAWGDQFFKLPAGMPRYSRHQCPTSDGEVA